jgi:hypothetical protein
VLQGFRYDVDVEAPLILHLDLLRASLDARKQKVSYYDRRLPGSGTPRFYLFERYGFTLEPLAIEDSVQPFIAGIKAMTTVSLTPGDLRGQRLKYRLTRRPLDLLDWTILKARRLPGRIRRVYERFFGPGQYA